SSPISAPPRLTSVHAPPTPSSAYRRETAEPIPPPAPVTTATFPSSPRISPPVERPYRPQAHPAAPPPARRRCRAGPPLRLGSSPRCATEPHPFRGGTWMGEPPPPSTWRGSCP